MDFDGREPLWRRKDPRQAAPFAQIFACQSDGTAKQGIDTKSGIPDALGAPIDR